MSKLSATAHRNLPRFQPYVSVVIEVAITRRLPSHVNSGLLHLLTEADDLIVKHSDGSYGLRPNGRRLLGELQTLISLAVTNVLTR